jgi:hypothetical protein
MAVRSPPLRKLAISVYKKYIDYLENVVVYYLKEELIRTLDRPDPPYNEDDRPVVRPMVFRTNTGCQDEYYITPAHVTIPTSTPSRALPGVPALRRIYVL